MITHKIDLQRRIGRITRRGITTLHFTKSCKRLFGNFLVAGNIANLLIIGQSDQIISVRRILIAGVDRQKAARRLNRLVILLGHIVTECAHQLCPASPRRVRMLALNLIKQSCGNFILLVIKLVLGCSIQRIHVTRDITGITARLRSAAAQTEYGATRKHGRCGQYRHGHEEFFVHECSLDNLARSAKPFASHCV